MTPEQKELLIKDLCARLPYGVKVIEDNQIIYSVAISNAFDIISEFDRLDIKPILFPLSAIKRKIEVNGEKVIVAKLLTSDISGEVVGLGRISIPIEPVLPLFDTFHRYHIDYRNLIGQGLAISVFDLPKNPYK